MILEEVAAVLESIGAAYALIGGRAVVLRGYPRMTTDYDFLTADRRIMQRQTWQTFEDAGAKVDIRKGDQFDPVAGVVHITFADGGDADVVLAKWKWEAAVIERAEPLLLRGRRIPVPTISDLILLKLAAGGPQDTHDVERLLQREDREQVIQEVEEKLSDLKPDAHEAWRRVLASR